MVLPRHSKYVAGGSIDIHKLIGKLPVRPKKGFVLPGHRYTGPYNPLHEQLDENDEPKPGQEPFNAVDAISMRHDICYRDHPDNKHGCDDKMLQELTILKPKDIREKIDRRLIKTIIGAKRKMGWGIVKWSNELANELHKPIRHKFPKRKVFTKNVDDIWAADLVEMNKLSKFNKGYKYLLTVIDVFSKYGWIIPLKNKTGVSVANGLKMIFKQDNRKPSRIWTDKGKEFYNKTVKSLLEKDNILLYSTENEEKSSVVERWNRTMKRNMWKYFTANNTHVYINILPQLVDRYNTTYHRSIKGTPQDASRAENFLHTFNSLYSNTSKLVKKPKFKVGDTVRITKKKKMFEKGFTPNWTEELFTIEEVKPTKPPTYKIKDKKGEEIKGAFYEQELQKSKQAVFRIERVLKKRTRRNGQKEIYVKWKGYTNTFNSWIPINDVQQYGS